MHFYLYAKLQPICLGQKSKAPRLSKLCLYFNNSVGEGQVFNREEHDICTKSNLFQEKKNLKV